MKTSKSTKKPKQVAKQSAPRRLFRKKVLIPAAVLICVVAAGASALAACSTSDKPAAPTRSSAARQAVPAKPVVRKDTTPGEIKRDITYCSGQLLDMYEPSVLAFDHSPVVVYIHGGGWTLNDKSSEPDQLALLEELRGAGYTIVSLNYSKVPAAYYPQPVHDSLCAIRFLRAHAEKYFLDKDRIAVYGFSAGGYLAAAVGLLPDDSEYETSDYKDQSSRVQAVVTLAGLFDFTDGLTVGNRERIDRFLHGADPAHADVMSYISADDPPFLLIHGAQDQSVPIAQDEQLAAGLQEKGVAVERLVVEYAEHGLNPSGGEPVPSRDQVKAEITRFIRASIE